MFYSIRWLLLSLLLIILCQEINATHIIGGEINYRCLGDSTYEISLVVYRDCFYGVPYFDNPASIGFFDSDNELIREIGDNGQLFMFVRNDDTLSPILDDKCYVIPPDVCVHTTTYRDTITLPFREGGYFLSYQRCCRNETIVNIVDPDNAGASFTARISENALLECNNSAVFNEWPPIYICANTPINFDHSASDIDGDSLVYKLCEPLTGVIPSAPRPQPPNNPPYDPVVWNEPLFSFDNKLGGTDPLTIDPQTGLITGTPTIIGQFVVGVCVEEYRDGVLISTTNRDFQYNVGICQASTAAFFTAEFYCDQLEVRFENLSERSLGSKWYFGGIDNPIDSSTAFEPTFTFPDFGTYDVTLVSIGNFSDCNDTITQSVTILDLQLEVDVDIERGECSDTLDLKFIANVLSDSLSDFSYLWELNWSNQNIFSTDTFVAFSVSNTRQIDVYLRVIGEEFNCWKEVSFTYESDLILEDSLVRNVIACTRDTIGLFPGFYPGNSYLWSPADLLLDPPDSPNPRFFADTIASFTAEVFNENCTGVVFVNVGIYDEEEFKLAPDTICGSRTVQFTENPFAGFADITLWRFFEDSVIISSSLQPFPTYTWPSFGEKEVLLRPIRAYGLNCPDSIRQSIYLFDLDVVLEPSFERIECKDSLEVQLNAGVVGEIIGSHEFIWIINGTDTLENRDSIVNLIVTENQLVEVEVVFRNDFGCSSSASLSFQSNLLPQLRGYEELSVCLGDSIQLNPPVISGVPFSWDKTDFFLSPSNSADPWVKPDTSIIYRLESRFEDCTYSYYFDIEVVEYTAQLDSFFICDSVLTQVIELPFPDSLILGWFVGEINSPILSGEQNSFSVEFPDFGSYPFTLIVRDSISECIDTIFSNISIFDITAWEAEIVVVKSECIGDSINLILIAEILGEFSDDGEIDILWIINVDTITTNISDSLFLSFAETPIVDIVILIEDGNECSQFFSRIIEFEFVEIIDLIDTLIICKGDSVNLLPSFNSGWDYVWSPAEGLLEVITTSNPLASPQNSTLYTAEINSETCIGSKSVFVEVLDLPIVLDVSASPNEIIFGDESFLNAIVEGDIVSVSWDPDETLDDPNILNPIARPTETTTYTVIIETEDGCLATGQITITVLDLPCEDAFIFIPNAFTPNDDGVNDIFRVRSVNIDRMSFVVYNRWGQEVFRTEDVSKGWDGTFKGKEMPPDVYAWHLEADCIGGERFIQKGNVNLIR
ncbi:MAG: gliding motility-associated C-terminal domain-containing protein [Saprospirales bacterium]|nr:MAG: gliding motility-associated C-terminal domain-containing protein [Saprospirales bacterium]